ncbi:MAG TPA: FAD:protein FMN transferase [Terracidiphilus sp.]|nr:FAD:protein FMN transferase [Terracidiphilus sp.]HUX28476.1 FAD:protein FMN transferase [Terracidiphilus sp.]
MNTRFSIVLVDIDTDKAEELAVAAENDLRAHERMMSRFDAQGPLSDLNRSAGHIAIQPPQELWEILLLCREYWRRTHGAFDITLWPIHHLWREHLERGEEPSGEDIDHARAQTGFARLHLDEAAQTVRFEREGMSIDLGGFGKGYALERLAASLRAQGVERAFLSFGESSITVLGSHPYGPAWPVGIANMFQPAQTVHAFQLHNASLSSSGTAPFNRMGGQRPFGQIIDPRSGRPIEGYRTMSVASPSGIEAEVLSTALLVTPARDRQQLLSGFSCISAVETVYHSDAEDFAPNIEWKYGL